MDSECGGRVMSEFTARGVKGNQEWLADYEIAHQRA